MAIRSPFLLSTLLLLLAGPGFSQLTRFQGNYRIYPGAVNQTEVLITRSPVNPDLLFSSCNTITFLPFFVSEGIYVTTDGGETWRGSDTCQGAPIDFHGGDAGISIGSEGTMLLTRLGRYPFAGLYSHYSNDNGLTWSAQKAISTDDLERAALCTNTQSGSPGVGRSYAVWVKFAYPFPLMFAHTDNFGQQWSQPRAINSPPSRSAGGDVAVGPGGVVVSCWAGVTDVTPFQEVHVGFARSQDAGDNWLVTEQAFPISGISGVLTNKANIRVNSLPSLAVDTSGGPRRGWIYIVTTERGRAPAGSDPDITLRRSEDGGTTWSDAIRVNQDPLNNGKTQYFPALCIDRFGAVNVVFYDDRNTTNDSTGLFLARSVDGGLTWNEYEVSDHNFKPVPIGGLGQGYQGDLIDITATATTLWPVWMDNSTGVYQVYTMPVPFSLVGMEEPQNSTPTVRCFPNPASGNITLQSAAGRAHFTHVTIMDAFGKIRLMDQPASGTVSLNVDCSGWPPGIYIARIERDGMAPETVRFTVLKP